MMYAYSPFEPLVALSIVLLLVFVVVKVLEKRKTWIYRKELVDLYVASKTRQLANESKLDLSLEYENYKKWAKKKKTENPDYTLDQAIEDDLMEEVNKEKKSK